jgi:hypothetical protein
MNEVAGSILVLTFVVLVVAVPTWMAVLELRRRFGASRPPAGRRSR